MDNRHVRILLVEDNPGDVRLIKEYLAKSAYGLFEVYACDRLDAATEFAAENEVGTVLLDLGLPDSAGLETFRRFHEAFPQLPTLVLTGLDDGELAVAAVQAGAQDYLTKGTMDSESLVRSIRYAIGRAEADKGQALTAKVLSILNRPNEWQALIVDILDAILASTGLEAAAIRIEQGGDFPYEAHRGFPPEFVLAESSLIDRDETGKPKKDANGKKQLACMCGNVICGRTDPAFPFFTENGSFWTNSTTQLLASTSEADRQSSTRNQCHAFGYESVALIPVRAGDGIIGLLQLNDHRQDQFPPESIRFFEGLTASIGVAYKRQQSETRIKQLLARQTQINQLTLELGQTLDVSETYTTIYEHIRSLMDAEAFIVGLFDSTSKMISAGFVVTRGHVRDTALFPPIPLEQEGRGTQSQVIRTGKPLVVPDWQEAMRNTTSHYRVTDKGNVEEGSAAPDSDAETDFTRSALLVPMQVEGRTLGVLQVQSRRLDAYEQDDVEMLAGLANVAAIALQTALLYEKADSDATILRSSLEGTIRALADTTEARDPYTAGHQRRVAELSAAIARQLGMSEDIAEGVYMAGLVHDVGKIATPAEILSKPGKLSDVEFSLIKAHAEGGYDILKSIQFPWPIAQAVLQHHERMDGSGYPHAVSGEAICMEARIIAVADVIEAMANHRPYRAALGIAAALEEIEAHKNVRYDEDVANACLKLFREEAFTFSE